MSRLRTPGPKVRRRPRRSRRAAVTPRRVAVRGLVVIAILGVVAYVALTAYNGVPFKQYGTLYVEVPDIGNLLQHDQVRVNGARVGQVMDEQPTRSGEARVKLQMEPSLARVPVGTTVSIRAAGLLGARYVQLIPGHSRQLLPDGATIYGSRSSKVFGIPETLDVLNRQTRGNLGIMLRELGTSFLGNGMPLNDGIRVASGAQRPFQQLAQTLLARRVSLADFVPSFESMMAPLNAARNQYAAMLAPTTRALQPFIDQEPQVQAMFEQAPPAFSSVETGLGNGRRLLVATADLAGAANAALPPAPDALRRATALLQTSPAPLRATTALLRAVEPTVPAALRITSGLSPELGQLQQAFTELVPLDNRVAQYGCDITHFAAVYRSMTGFAVPGPNGAPNGEFRLQVAPSPAEALQTASPANNRLAPRNPYWPPCAFLGSASTTDPIDSAIAGMGGR